MINYEIYFHQSSRPVFTLRTWKAEFPPAWQEGAALPMPKAVSSFLSSIPRRRIKKWI